jgi:hypothetical protein
MSKKAMIALAVSGMMSALCMPLFAAKTLYVVPPDTPNHTPASPYGSWDTAATSIDDAITAATGSQGEAGTGDMILVAPGTYNITSTLTPNKRRLTIKSAKIGNEEEEDRENTILDGGGKTAIMNITAAFVSISGFTFANGYKELASYSSNSGSAAVKIGEHYGSVSNCIFRGNRSINAPGCVQANGKWVPVVSGCIFTNNTLEVSGSDTLRGCAVYMWVNASDANGGRIENCYFADNRSKSTGDSSNSLAGGVVFSNYADLDNCEFGENTYTNTVSMISSGNGFHGGYVYLGDNNSPGRCSMSNCRFSGRTIELGDEIVYGSIAYINCSDCVVSNCTFDAIEEVAGIRYKGVVSVARTSAKFIGCKFVGGNYDGLAIPNGSAGSIVQLRPGAFNSSFRNCLFANNNIKGNCYAIRQESETSAATGFSVENCTFANNTVGQTISSLNSSTCTNYLVNSVFTSNVYLTAPGAVRNCCLKSHSDNAKINEDNFIPSEVGGDLKFVDAANSDYHLQQKSPLRNRGMLLDWMTAGAVDLDGNPRVHLDLPDVGCYESQYDPLGFILILSKRQKTMPRSLTLRL